MLSRDRCRSTSATGLRVRRPRARVADRAVRRAAPLALPGGARHSARRSKRRGEQRPSCYCCSSSPARRSPGSTAPALGCGRHTNLAMVEYWRWWVVHLWVEGFFEVFATVVIAFLFARLKLVRLAHGRRSRRAVRRRSSSPAASSARCHHLYFSGTPTVVLALGLGVQRAGSRAAALRRLRSLAEPAALEGAAVGAPLPVADLLLRRRRVLESWSAPGCSAS